MKQTVTDNFPLFLVAAIASIALSTWFFYHKGIINPDGICYVVSAEMIPDYGLKSAMNLCGQAKWPLYPWLISLLGGHGIWSYVSAAHSLNALFSLATVLLFLLITHTLGANQRTLWFACGIILFAHSFNHARGDIVRDHGYWAFYLGSIYVLLTSLTLSTQSAWVNFGRGILFSLILIGATLFRLEGAVFLLLIPIIVSLLVLDKKVFVFSLGAYLPLLLSALSFIAWSKTYPDQQQLFGRLPELWQQSQLGVIVLYQHFIATKAVVTQSLLNKYSYQDAGFITVVMLMTWYLLYLVKTLTLGNCLLFVYAILKKIQFTLRQHKLLGSYVLVNILITFFFLVENYFLSKRYLIALCLSLLIYTPFALDALYLQAKQQFWHRCALFCIVVLLIGSGISGIYNPSASKAYIKMAGDWMQQHIPKTASLYVNDAQLMYYSQHFKSELFDKMRAYESLPNSALDTFNYLAIRNKKSQQARHFPGFKRIKQFQNEYGDSVEILTSKKE